MRKYLFVILFIVLLFNQAFAIEAGKWNFVVQEEYCYIGSAPIDSDIKTGLNRGPTYILVYRINKGLEKTIQISAGYNYKEGKAVLVSIDQVKFEFFSKEDSAWTINDDEKVIYAMKKGNEMKVKGESSRGNVIVDTYTLKGFTSAFSKLSKNC